MPSPKFKVLSPGNKEDIALHVRRYKASDCDMTHNDVMKFFRKMQLQVPLKKKEQAYCDAVLAALPPMQRRQGSWGQYAIVKKLGEGSYGTVFLVVNKRTNKEFALKVQLVDPRDLSNFRAEIRLQNQAAKADITLKIVDYTVVPHPQGKNKNYLAFLLMPTIFDTLENFLHTPGIARLPSSFYTSVAESMGLILYRLIKMRMSHTDLHTGNVAIFYDMGKQELYLKLIDFGLATEDKSLRESVENMKRDMKNLIKYVKEDASSKAVGKFLSSELERVKTNLLHMVGGR